MEWAELRNQVLQRAAGKCENPRCRKDLHKAGVEVDHWLGGGGRRTQKQSIETCWALCVECHQDRTLNLPDAEAWNAHFQAHCAKHGYDFVPHYVNTILDGR